MKIIKADEISAGAFILQVSAPSFALFLAFLTVLAVKFFLVLQANGH
ncbi:MAG TPA: hypothetical protein VGK99_11085 [Acidobacteriota bacterium]